MPDIYTLLKQYDDLLIERADIMRRIQRLDRELKEIEHTVVSDSVEGTRSDGTYGSIRIEGIPLPEYDERRKQLRKKHTQYAKTEAQIQELIDLIDEGVNAVADPAVRTIIRLRYIDGEKWEGVARKMGMNANTCRSRVDRYFQKKNQNNA